MNSSTNTCAGATMPLALHALDQPSVRSAFALLSETVGALPRCGSFGESICRAETAACHAQARLLPHRLRRRHPGAVPGRGLVQGVQSQDLICCRNGRTKKPHNRSYRRCELTACGSGSR